MSQPIPTQHPAVVLRSQYTHLRILLAITLITVIGLSTAVVILADDTRRATSATPTAATHSQSAGSVLVIPPTRGAPGASLRVAPPPAGQRDDGGPDEGTRGIVAQAPSTRSDGGCRVILRRSGRCITGRLGPDEGSRGPGR